MDPSTETTHDETRGQDLRRGPFGDRAPRTPGTVLPPVDHDVQMADAAQGESGSSGDLGAGSLTVRRGVLDDTAEVIRLAAAMYEAMGMDVSGTTWRRSAADHLASRLGDEVLVFVVDDPTAPGRLAATGAGSIATRLPGPGNPDAKVGYIQWVSTDPAWRRRGLARSITAALVEWFAERAVGAVELHATKAGEPMYRALNFNEGPNPALRMRLEPSMPGAR